MASGNEKKSIQDVVNSIGIGHAQFSALLLSAGGVSFADGAEIAVVSIVAVATADEFNLSPNEKGLLMTMAVSGMFAGIICAGYVGDTFGRRPAVVTSLAMTALLGMAAGCASSYTILVGCRTVLGFGMGLGIPPSVALLSEITPADRRMLMRALNYICWNAGTLFVAAVAGLDDPTFKHLNWRKLLWISSAPVIIVFVFASFCLPESPVFLESIGEHSAARMVLDSMRIRNGVPNVDIGYVSQPKAQTESGIPLMQQIGVLFSAPYWFVSMIAAYASFCIMFTSYGVAYAAPQVLPDIAPIAAAWEMVSSCAIFFVIVFALLLISDWLSRKATTMLALFSSAACCANFALAGGLTLKRSWLLTTIFQIGYFGNTASSTLGYMVLFQIAVEIYPASSSASGGSFVIGVGRIGALLAPLLFEDMSAAYGWASYFGLACAMNLFGALLCCFLPTIENLKDKAARELAKFEEEHSSTSGMLDNRRAANTSAKNYGTASSA